jgi:hypothetical protein
MPSGSPAMPSNGWQGVANLLIITTATTVLTIVTGSSDTALYVITPLLVLVAR